jgi:hypothetical protein
LGDNISYEGKRKRKVLFREKLGKMIKTIEITILGLGCFALLFAQAGAIVLLEEARDGLIHFMRSKNSISERVIVMREEITD